MSAQQEYLQDQDELQEDIINQSNQQDGEQYDGGQYNKKRKNQQQKNISQQNGNFIDKNQKNVGEQDYEEAEEDIDDGEQVVKKLKQSNDEEQLEDIEGNDENDNYPNYSEAEEDLDAENKENMKGFSQKSKKKQLNKEMDYIQIKTEVLKLQNAMIDAYQQDVELLKSKKPALQKIKLLVDVERILLNNDVQEEFLNSNGLENFASWLSKPNKDFPQPSFFLKQKLLQIINKLNVNKKEDIQNNNLATIIMSIYKNKEENKDLVKMAKIIIDKWTRILENNSINYKLKISDIELEQLKKRNEYQRNIDQQKQGPFVKKDQSRYVIIPEQKKFNFIIDPYKEEEIGRKRTRQSSIKQHNPQQKNIYKLLQDIHKNRKRI